MRPSDRFPGCSPRQKFIDFRNRPIVNYNVVSIARHVENKIFSHDSKTDQTNIRVRQTNSPCFTMVGIATASIAGEQSSNRRISSVN
jgi:hypothetical protein